MRLVWLMWFLVRKKISGGGNKGKQFGGRLPFTCISTWSCLINSMKSCISEMSTYWWQKRLFSTLPAIPWLILRKDTPERPPTKHVNKLEMARVSCKRKQKTQVGKITHIDSACLSLLHIHCLNYRRKLVSTDQKLNDLRDRISPASWLKRLKWRVYQTGQLEFYSRFWTNACSCNADCCFYFCLFVLLFPPLTNERDYSSKQQIPIFILSVLWNF